MNDRDATPARARALPRVGDALPPREHRPDNVQLFLYNAVLWNAHRIHFDAPYTTGVEGYPGLVVAGPLIGDWLNQCVEEWLGDDGRLTAIEYSNRVAAYVGDTLTSGGTVTAVDSATGAVEVEVFVRNAAGEVIAPGRASVAWASP
jgi:hydroxyacyl-ACP dehydratase HTD2-like protein with hotdog domain